MSSPDTMTVLELMAKLGSMPTDAPVLTEGCDCNGAAVGVVLEEDGVVLIQRPRSDGGTGND